MNAFTHPTGRGVTLPSTRSTNLQLTQLVRVCAPDTPPGRSGDRDGLTGRKVGRGDLDPAECRQVPDGSHDVPVVEGGCPASLPVLDLLQDLKVAWGPAKFEPQCSGGEGAARGQFGVVAVESGEQVGDALDRLFVRRDLGAIACGRVGERRAWLDGEHATDLLLGQGPVGR